MLRRNEEGEPIDYVPQDYDCGLDKDFYIDNPHLLDDDYDSPEECY